MHRIVTDAADGVTTPPAFPALGVVTADGGTTIPAPVLDRMASTALAANRARLESYAPLVAEIETSEGLAKSHAAARLALAVTTRTAIPARREAPVALNTTKPAGRRRGLHLAPPPAPVQPATPCPQWCAAEHQDDDPDTTHHGDLQWYGPLGFWLYQTDGVTSIRMELETGMEFEMLDADAAEQLGQRLADALRMYAAAARAELLAGPYGSPVSQFPTGGAA
jgi:hypothetical protein